LATRTREPAASIRPVPHVYPNRDPVSVAVDALTSHAYRRLLEDAGFRNVQGRITGSTLDAVLATKL